jgi:hypothetical protein
MQHDLVPATVGLIIRVASREVVAGLIPGASRAVRIDSRIGKMCLDGRTYLSMSEMANQNHCGQDTQKEHDRNCHET